MFKRTICIFFILSAFPLALFANASAEAGGMEIPNLVSAVKAAAPGDYILLKSGKKYVLTREEIEIVRGNFDYDDLQGVRTETRIDKTEILTISESHVLYRYPDGQSTHILKTGPAFTPFMEHIEKKYFIIRYVDYLGGYHDFQTISSPRFNVFRASAQFQKISNGTDTLEAVTITAYNYKGQNYIIKFCAQQDMIWGNVSERNSYKPVGETREIEFDIE